jgi:hypothetical protein
MVEPVRPQHAPRAKIALPCTLRRRVGSPIQAQTVEVGPEGMRISSPRPLAADETVTFDLPDLDMKVTGSARVTSQQRLNIYVLRFEHLPAPMVKRLHSLAVNQR